MRGAWWILWPRWVAQTVLLLGSARVPSSLVPASVGRLHFRCCFRCCNRAALRSHSLLCSSGRAYSHPKSHRHACVCGLFGCSGPQFATCRRAVLLGLAGWLVQPSYEQPSCCSSTPAPHLHRIPLAASCSITLRLQACACCRSGYVRVSRFPVLLQLAAISRGTQARRAPHRSSRPLAALL